MKIKKKFTIVELLIVTVLSTLISGIILSIYIVSFRWSISGFDHIGILQDLRNHTHKIFNDLKNCRKIIELKEDHITIRTIDRSLSDTAIINVSYSVDKKNSIYVIKRIVENEDDEILYKFNKLNKDIFSAYIENIKDCSFSKYDDSFSNSYKKDKIVMIKINFSGSIKEDDKDIPINMVTKITLDYLKEKLEDKYWNYRK